MFERQTVWSGEQGQSTKFLTLQRDVAKSIGQFISDCFAGGNFFTGLAATPGTGLTVAVGAGALYQSKAVDPTAWSTLASDSSVWSLLGLNLAPQTLSGFSAPGTSGQSINYLIEAQIQVTDTSTVNTPFYNSSNPAAPTFIAKSPTRQNLIAFQVKAGTAASTGTQVTPTADSGWIPLWVVTVDFGETSLVSNDIVLATAAPKFYGFVQINPSGNTPVYLSPASQQTGFININGAVEADGGMSFINVSAGTGSTHKTAIGASVAATIGAVSGTVWYAQDLGNGYMAVLDGSGNLGLAGGLTLGGGITYAGSHAGTDADPYPLSGVNAAMLGGKIAADYALAAGSYITVYAGTPTLATGNAGVTGTLQANVFQSNVASGTSPLVVSSITQVANLNVSLLGGNPPGNASGNIPVSNGTLCVNLNSQLLNGQPSSAFQPAGSYAQMNVTNTGSFTATGAVVSTGSTGSTQVTLSYAASNAWGVNQGGGVAYISAAAKPLALIGSRIETNGPLYVGGYPNQNQFISGSDLWLNGMLRGGMVGYTITLGFNGNSHPFPGNGTGMGTIMSPLGSINVPGETMHGSQYWVSFRTKATFSSQTQITFYTIGLPTLDVWIDGVKVGTAGFGVGTSVSYTFSAGSHVIDLVYGAYQLGQAFYLGTEGTSDQWGGTLMVAGWVPQLNGQASTSVTSSIPY